MTFTYIYHYFRIGFGCYQILSLWVLLETTSNKQWQDLFRVLFRVKFVCIHFSFWYSPSWVENDGSPILCSYNPRSTLERACLSVIFNSSWIQLTGASVKFHTHYLNHSKSTHCIAGRNLQHRTTGWIQQVISIINIQKRKIGLVIRTSLAILAQKIVSSLWIAPPQETVAPKKQTSTSCGFLGSCLIIPDPRPWWVHESKIGESNTITAWCLAYCWYTVDILLKNGC